MTVSAQFLGVNATQRDKTYTAWQPQFATGGWKDLRRASCAFHTPTENTITG